MCGTPAAINEHEYMHDIINSDGPFIATWRIFRITYYTHITLISLITLLKFNQSYPLTIHKFLLTKSRHMPTGYVKVKYCQLERHWTDEYIVTI
jgi:hypothetical protein